MKKPYIFKRDTHYIHHQRLDRSVNFEAEYLSIRSGQIFIPVGYAWDGCTPCFSVLGLFTINTPNGHLVKGKPITYDASCLHDALIQYRSQHYISRDQVNLLFYQHLVYLNFPLAKLYYKAVQMGATKEGWNA